MILQDIEQMVHNFFFDHQQGLWHRYKRWKLSQYDIPVSDMAASGATDADGNLTLKIYDNHTQRDLVIAALYLWADGYTPASAFVGASDTWCGLFPDSNMSPANAKDLLPTSPQGQVFPQIARYNKHNAPRFKSGENVWFNMVEGPASTNITVRFDGWLKPAGTNEDL